MDYVWLRKTDIRIINSETCIKMGLKSSSLLTHGGGYGFEGGCGLGSSGGIWCDLGVGVVEAGGISREE